MGRRAWYIKILRLSLNHLRNTVEILDNCWKNQEKTSILSKKLRSFCTLVKSWKLFFQFEKHFEIFKASCKNSWQFLAHVMKPILIYMLKMVQARKKEIRQKSLQKLSIIIKKSIWKKKSEDLTRFSA